ncbi:hypothetical protein CRE_12980 [Caenorhabditis remanei]|uniref:F-box domain-containing protein n=1 Tax=Caenorhabditis remanei TaxID=31234 RepID=E3N140_CAERE|nr:hypothetical protein CRE_12980 [Caenorhabditis remanei]
MPENVMLKITEAVGFPSIFTLRKVCRGYRNFIDDQIPSINLTDIIIHVHQQRMYLYYDIPLNKKLILYKNHPAGCVVNHEGREYVMKNEEFLSVFLRDFELIMKHQNSALEQFHFDSGSMTNDEEFRQYISSIFAKIKKILKSRPRPLKVKEFAMSIFRQEDVMSILPFLDANLLTSISMFHPNYGAFVMKETAVELNEVVALAQWRNAKHLNISYLYVTEPVENLFGFTKIKICIKVVSGNDLFLIKEKFMSPDNQIEEFLISYKELVDTQLLGECISTEHGDQIWYYRTYHYNKILTISKINWTKKITVSFIDRSAVSENVLIQ